MQPLGWGKIMEDGFNEIFELLESEPEPTVLYIDTDGMRRDARSVKDGQGTRVGSLALMLIDCCDYIDQLQKKPDPTEFTKIRRSRYDVEIENVDRLYDKDIAEMRKTNIKIKYEWDIKACDIIDRLTAENATLKEHYDSCPLLKGSHDVSEFYPDEQALKGGENHAGES